MSTKWSDVVIECPYYRGMDERGGKTYITCDGGGQDVSLQMMFSSGEARRRHVQRHCAGARWTCPACMALDFAYELPAEGER